MHDSLRKLFCSSSDEALLSPIGNANRQQIYSLPLLNSYLPACTGLCLQVCCYRQPKTEQMVLALADMLWRMQRVMWGQRCPWCWRRYLLKASRPLSLPPQTCWCTPCPGWPCPCPLPWDVGATCPSSSQNGKEMLLWYAVVATLILVAGLAGTQAPFVACKQQAQRNSGWQKQIGSKQVTVCTDAASVKEVKLQLQGMRPMQMAVAGFWTPKHHGFLPCVC